MNSRILNMCDPHDADAEALSSAPLHRKTGFRASAILPVFFAFIGFIAFFGLCSEIHAEILGEDLAGSGWHIRDPSAADPATDDSSWSVVELPGNLADRASTSASRIWLRRSITIDPSAGVYALYAGRVAGNMEVYVNGLPARQLQLFDDGPALFALPAPTSAGPAVLALRLEIRRGLPVGILAPPLRLMDLQKAYRTLFQDSIPSLTLALFYGGIALFFFLIRRPEQTARAEFIYAIAAGVGILASVQVRSLFLSSMPAASYGGPPASWIASLSAQAILLHLSVALATMLPLALYRFLEQFTDAGIPILRRWLLPLTGIVAAASFALGVSHLDRAYQILLSVWYVAWLPVWGVTGFRLIRQTARTMRPAGLALIGMLLYFLYASITLLIGGDYFTGQRSGVSLFFAPGLLVPALVLGVEYLWNERKDGWSRGHAHSSDLFSSILPANVSMALQAPLRTALEGLHGDPQQARAADRALTGMEQMMDDILELSRLEMQTETPPITSVDAENFLREVFPESTLSRAFHLDTGTLLETNPDLLRSALTRFVQFPGFSSFDHIDLIATTDQQDRLHLRFLMHQPDRGDLRRVYDILSGGQPDVGGLWIQWRILVESLRLLRGQMQMRTLSGKYLTIDMTLPARNQSPRTGEAKTIPLILLHEDNSPPPTPPIRGWKAVRRRLLALLQKEIA